MSILIEAQNKLTVSLKETLDKAQTELNKNLDKIKKNYPDMTEEEIAKKIMFMNKQSTTLLRYLISLLPSDEELCKAIVQDWKEWERCYKYVFTQAYELQFNGSCMIDHETVYSWCREYWFLDDKDQVYAEREEKEKKEAERMEKIRKAKKLEEKALEKAKEQCEAEEGWAELSDKDKQAKITTAKYKIKLRLESQERAKNKKAEASTNEKKAKKTRKAKGSTPEANEEPVNESKEVFTEKIEIDEASVEQLTFDFI